MMIEKIAASLNNDNFFSKNHILTKSFADSQFTKPIKLVLNQKSQNTIIFHITNKTYF